MVFLWFSYDFPIFPSVLGPVPGSKRGFLATGFASGFLAASAMTSETVEQVGSPVEWLTYQVKISYT